MLCVDALTAMRDGEIGEAQVRREERSRAKKGWSAQSKWKEHLERVRRSPEIWFPICKERHLQMCTALCLKIYLKTEQSLCPTCSDSFLYRTLTIRLFSCCSSANQGHVQNQARCSDHVLESLVMIHIHGGKRSRDTKETSNTYRHPELQRTAQCEERFRTL